MEGELESFWKYGKLKNENINKSTKRNGCFNMVKRFIRLFAIVDTKMNWGGKKTEVWFKTKNPDIGGITPIDFFNQNYEKCERWILTTIEENKLEF